MIFDAVLLDQCDEVPLCVTTECRDAEFRVGGNKMGWIAMRVGEITTTTTRHQYFLANLVGAFEHNDAASTITRRNGAHEASGATAQDNYIVFIHGGNIAGEATK